MSPPPPTPTPTHQSSWLGALTVALPLVVPSGAGIALLYYLGMTRNEAFFRYFGLSSDAIGLDVARQVSESADVVVMAAAALILLSAVYIICLATLRISTSAAVGPRLRCVFTSVVALIFLGMLSLLLVVASVGSVRYAALAMPVLIGALAIIVYLTIRSVVSIGTVSTLVGAVGSGPTRAMKTVILIAVILAIFVVSANYAVVVGQSDAEMVARNLNALPGASVYSKHELPISSNAVKQSKASPAVSAPAPAKANAQAGASASQAEYPYSYSGLKVLARAGNEYLLIQTSWRPGVGAVFPIFDNDQDVRIEFQSA